MEGMFESYNKSFESLIKSFESYNKSFEIFVQKVDDLKDAVDSQQKVLEELCSRLQVSMSCELPDSDEE